MIYNGYTTSATFNSNSSDNTYPAVTLTVNYSTINGYVKTSVPVITPYGFVSVPIDNKTCSYAGVGQFNAAVVLGYTNTQPPSNVPTTLGPGEVSLFSHGNYTFSIQNDKLHIAFTNSNGTFNTRVTNDENVNIVLIDVIAEIAALEAKLNDLITKYNSHTHAAGTYNIPSVGSVVGTSGSGTPTETAYTATTNFTRDQSFLGSNGINNFVDSQGKAIV